ncbi:hypothetical protein J6590_082841 [Homalodisca vitripennis]|nr:hypothetical protein J6590_082841 [Homalodisca vitripennis]
MDPSVRPCDDFYKFACGKFLESAELRLLVKERTGHGGYMTVSGGGLRVDCWLASLDRWLKGSGVM